MDGVPASFLEDLDTPQITQFYTADGKRAGRQIRQRTHLIFVPDEPEPEPEPRPKTLLPTAALLLTVMLVFWPQKRSPR
jgi:hypothetical protein